MKRSVLFFVISSLVATAAVCTSPAQAQRDLGAQAEAQATREEQLRPCCVCTSASNDSFCMKVDQQPTWNCAQFQVDVVSPSNGLTVAQKNILRNYTCQSLNAQACAVIPPAETAPANTTQTTPPSSSSAGQNSPRCRNEPFTSIEQLSNYISPPDTDLTNASATSRPFQSIRPQLSVPIPGLTFSDATKEGTFVSVPFLAQYISAIYRYAIGLAAIAAVIMIVYGGFRYLTGSAGGSVQQGKQIVIDAIIGLFIVLGAYAILETINPNTLDLRPLQLASIDRVDIDEELMRVQGNTNNGEGGQSGSAEAITGDGQLIVGPNGDVRYNGCPIQLTSPIVESGTENPRKAEFRQRILPLISSYIGTRNCVVRVVAASAACQIHAGSCNQIPALANSLCQTASSKIKTHDLLTNAVFQNALRSKSAFNAAYPQFASLNQTNTSSTKPTKAAVRAVASQLVPGWPQNWTRDLQPGDHVYIYNGNRPDTHGAHSMVFMGWINSAHTTARIAHGWSGQKIFSQQWPNFNNELVIRTYSYRGSAGAVSQNAASNEIVRIPFTYCPGGTCDGTRYVENSASILIHSSYLSKQNVSLRAMLYIHGLNQSHRTADQANYINNWKTVLGGYYSANGPAVAVITPHSMSGAASYFDGLNGPAVLQAAQVALQRAFAEHHGSYTLRDISIGAHSAGLCGGHIVRAAQASYGVPIRGVMALDGCLGSVASCPNSAAWCPRFEPRTLTSCNSRAACLQPSAAYILNTDINSASDGMGSAPKTDAAVTNLGFTVSECSGAASGIAGITRCFSKNTGGNNGWYLYETNVGHDQSLQTIGPIALRAFFGNPR